MIRLIASDLDGTLLLPGGVLPEETFPLIEKLHEKGILFCVASGRQYESLLRLFAPVRDKVLFIAENGALVYYRGENLFCTPLPSSAVPDVLRAVRGIEGACPLVCCALGAYAEDTLPSFLSECTRYYPLFRRVERLEGQAFCKVCKIAVYNENGSASAGDALAALLPDLRVTVSGKVWTDVSLKEVNKGNALSAVLRLFSLKKEECMAFGDYMNDYEMLLVCGQAFVTENGYPPLIEKIGRTVPANTQKGVLQKIRELIGEQK